MDSSLRTVAIFPKSLILGLSTLTKHRLGSWRKEKMLPFLLWGVLLQRVGKSFQTTNEFGVQTRSQGSLSSFLEREP